jgi:type I restriction enzyme, S subunit
MSVEAILGPLPNDWSYTTLGDACNAGGGGVQTGPFGSQLHASDYVEEGIPSIMPANIGDNRIVEQGIARISEEDAARLEKYRVQPGDIVYSRRGDVERRALVRQRESGWLCGTGCLRVRVGENGHNPVFTTYYLGHPKVRQWIVRHAQGATMANLNTSILSNLPFIEVPPPAQLAIAKILGDLDDKIDLLRDMNRILEELARAVFQAWFVDFEPIRAKAAGATSFRGMPQDIFDTLPNSFEQSENGEIPTGWGLKRFSSIVEHPRRAANPNEIASTTPYIGLEHMPRRSITLDEWETAQKVSSNKHRFERHEILYGKLRPNFHKVGVVFVNGVCSTDIVVLRPVRKEFFGIALACASSDSFVAHNLVASDGTKMPRTNWEIIGRYEFFLPPLGAPIISNFDGFIRSIVCKLEANVFESITLARIRDTLLPQLISGELEVPSLEALGLESGE